MPREDPAVRPCGHGKIAVVRVRAIAYILWNWKQRSLFHEIIIFREKENGKSAVFRKMEKMENRKGTKQENGGAVIQFRQNFFLFCNFLTPSVIYRAESAKEKRWAT